jgi:hypothetical protein
MDSTRLPKPSGRGCLPRARAPRRSGPRGAGQRRRIVGGRPENHVQQRQRIVGSPQFLKQEPQLERGVAERCAIDRRLQPGQRVGVAALCDVEVREHGNRRGIIGGTSLGQSFRLSRLAVRNRTPRARRERLRWPARLLPVRREREHRPHAERCEHDDRRT